MSKVKATLPWERRTCQEHTVLELLTQASRLTESLVAQGRQGSKRQYSVRGAAVEVSSWGPHTQAGQLKRLPAEGSLGLGLGLLSGLPSWGIWQNRRRLWAS